MAKSKSNSSKKLNSKTPSQPHSNNGGPRKDRKSASFNKRKADSNTVDTQKHSKRPAVGNGRNRPTEKPLDEATFKRQFAANFYDVPMKKEPADTTLAQPPTPAVSRSLPNTSSRVHSLPPSPAPPQDGERDQITNSARKDFSPEEVLVSIIFRQPFVEQLAKIGIEQFIQEGGPCHDFGISRVQGFITRLDGMGIVDGLRTRVVDLLQQNLQDFCNALHARISDIGTLSSESARPPSAKRGLSADAGHSETSIIYDDQGGLGVKDPPSKGKKLSFSAVSAMNPTSDSQSIIQKYGTKSMKCGFDLLSRCVIDACSLAPRDGDDPSKIRRYAHQAWLKVDHHRKGEWQNLFDARHDPGTNIFAIGQDLLRSQQLLALVVPGYHSRVGEAGPLAARVQKNAEKESAPHPPRSKYMTPRRYGLHDQNPSIGFQSHTPRLEPSPPTAKSSTSCKLSRPHTIQDFAY